MRHPEKVDVRRFGTACALWVLAASAGCGTSSTPTTADEVRAFAQQSLDLIATGLQREDAMLASTPASDGFTMDNNVAIRYLDAGWNGAGVGAMRSFFDDAFQVQQNISQTFHIVSFHLVGDVASVVVTSDYSSVRVDKTPPENTTASTEDILVFQLEPEGWRLYRWFMPLPPQEPPPA